MKTKFFKKLSFVLVVAMVLSLFVPAVGAFAASSVKLNSTKKYLHLGRDDANEFNFNIKGDKQKGWKYFWESANEAIAEVNEKNGVTIATGVGTTKITLTITDKDGEEVETLVATVVVRDNIEEVTISNPVEKLGVGDEHDYNRSFVTEAASTKKTSSIVRWTVEPTEGATINEKGVFTATAAGEYKVTAHAFQSSAKYADWVKDPVKYADYVLDTDETTVVVSGSMKEAKQVDVDTVDVLFDSAMTDVDKNISVYQVVGTTKVKQLVKKVTMSADKMKATVDVYVPFTAGADYVVEYTGLDPVTFKAATTKVEDVASIEVTTSTAVLNEATKVKFRLLNAAGVDITTTELANRVTMKSSGGVGTYFNATSKEVTVFTKDATTTITATFHTYKYDNAGKEATIEGAGVIVGVTAAATNVAGLNAWTIVNNNDPKFNDVKQSIAVGDTGYKLFAQFNTSDADTKYDNKTTPAKFDFVSSDKNILIVDQLGGLYPVKDGEVTVVISYGDAGSRAVVGAISITVGAQRKAASLTLSKTDVSLSNAAINDYVDVEVKVKDQYGADFTASYAVSKLEGSATGSPYDAGNSTATKVRFNGDSRAVGTYYYKVAINSTDLVAIVTVNVLDGTGTASSYKLQLSASSVDLKAEAGKIAKSVTIELFGYNDKGVKASKATIDGTNYVLSIKAPKTTWDYPANAKYNPATNVYTLATGVSPNAIDKAPVGTYEVTASVLISGNLVPQDVQYFTVTDSQPVPVVAEVKSRLFTNAVSSAAITGAYSSNASLINAVKEVLKFTLSGTEIATIQEVKAFGTTNEFAIQVVKIRQYIDGAYIDHEVTVGLTVSKK